MQKQTVYIGREGNRDSNIGDQTRAVEFEGEQLAKARNGDTRGTTKMLYRTAKGFVIHVKNWSRWAGESTSSELVGPVDEKELSDKFPELARKADLEVPASLDEVL